MQFPRYSSLLGNALQTVSALLFASYFFFGPIGGLVCLALWLFGVASARTLGLLALAYTLQLVLYRPHLHKGWPPLLLYSALTDMVIRYYDGTSVREGPAPDPRGRYLFAVYPHGVYGVCRAFSGGASNWSRLYPGGITARWGSFGAAFFMPGVREFSLLAGCLDASKKILVQAIEKHGENVMLLPGGIDEMALTDGTSKDTALVAADRKGYAKLAIECGCDIIPSFCFGEKWIHRTVLLPPMVRTLLYKTVRVSGTLLKGRGPTFLGFLGEPLGMVWGEPIPVKQQKPVDPAYLDEVHAQVQTAVRSIFDRHKASFGYGDDETLSFVTVAEARAAGKAARASRRADLERTAAESKSKKKD